MDPKIITIGRQLGSGGRTIGEKLASKMNFSFYDKELIGLASKESGLGKEFFEQVDEKTSHRFFGGAFGIHNVYSEDTFINNYLNSETLFNIQSDVIRNIANEHSAVIVGRCADYVLKDHKYCLNIFINASFDDRIKRVMGYEHISEQKALELIEKTDKKRAAYYNYFSNKTWGAAESYHLCIDSSVLGIDETVNFIEKFTKKAFNL